MAGRWQRTLYLFGLVCMVTGVAILSWAGVDLVIANGLGPRAVLSDAYLLAAASVIFSAIVSLFLYISDRAPKTRQRLTIYLLACAFAFFFGEGAWLMIFPSANYTSTDLIVGAIMTAAGFAAFIKLVKVATNQPSYPPGPSS